MVEYAFLPAVLAISAAAKSGVGSKIASGVTSLFGGKSNTDPTARATASAAGAVMRLGAPGNPAYGAAAPEPGTFYLALSDGQIYQSKAAGLYPVMKPWANLRKSAYRVQKLGLPAAPGGSEPGTTAAMSRRGGVGIILAAVAAFIVWKVVRR